LRHPVIKNRTSGRTSNEVVVVGHHQLMGPAKWSYFYLYVYARHFQPAGPWAGAWRSAESAFCSSHCSTMRSRNITCDPAASPLHAIGALDEGKGDGVPLPILGVPVRITGRKRPTTSFLRKSLQNPEISAALSTTLRCIEDARGFCRIFDWYNQTITMPGSDS